MIHALDMHRPPAHAYFRGAVFIDEMFRRSESGPRQAMLNYLTDSSVFMQGVSNAVVHLTTEVLAYLKAHDPTFVEVDAPAAAESSTGSSLTQLSPFSSFRAESPAKPLVQHELLPHEQIVAVQAAGQWLWATVWLVDENNTRGELAPYVRFAVLATEIALRQVPPASRARLMFTARDVAMAFHPAATEAAVKLLVIPGLPGNVRDDRLVPMLERVVRSAACGSHQRAFVRGLLSDPYTAHCLVAGPSAGLPGVDLLSSKAWVVELLQACVTGDQVAAAQFVARGGVTASMKIVQDFIVKRKRSVRDEPDICGRVCAHTGSTLAFLCSIPATKEVLDADPALARSIMQLTHDMLYWCLQMRHLEGVHFTLRLAADLWQLGSDEALEFSVTQLDLPHMVATTSHDLVWKRRGDAAAARLAASCALYFKSMAQRTMCAQKLSPLMILCLIELVACEGMDAVNLTAKEALGAFYAAHPSNKTLGGWVRQVEYTLPGLLFWLNGVGLGAIVKGNAVRSSSTTFVLYLALFFAVIVGALLSLVWLYLSAFQLV